MNNLIRIKGHVKLTARDAKTNEIIEVQNFNNIIVTNGYALLAGVLIGENTISHCGVGSDNTAPTISDTNIGIAVGARKPITSTSRAGAIALFSTFFSSADNNGTWREAILATSLSGASTIISHALFDNTFTKTNEKTCTIDWTLTIEGV